MQKTLTYHTDPGHGWLEVPRDDQGYRKVQNSLRNQRGDSSNLRRQHLLIGIF